MSTPDVAKPCKGHQWRKLDIKDRYCCVNCGAFGHGVGFGVQPYSGSKRLYEELHKIGEQSGRRA